ncbi:MAG: ABC transporter transmembrane domain-containing protein, partial [Chitinophagales bacterium]
MSTITKRTGKILDWDLFKRVVRLARPFKKAFIGATTLAILLAVISPIRPYLIQVTVDNYILIPNQSGLEMMAMILILVLIVESFFRYNFIYWTNWLGQSVIKNLRVRVFNHVLKFRLRYFDNTAIGTSTTRTINDVETINDIFSQGLITIIADLLTLFMVMGVMFYTDWKLTLMCLAPFPLIIYSTYIFKEK